MQFLRHLSKNGLVSATSVAGLLALAACSAGPMDGPKRTVALHVTDEATGQPLETFWVGYELDYMGANLEKTGVEMSDSVDDGWITTSETADEKGLAVLRPTPPQLNLDLWVFAPGHAMRQVQSPGAEAGSKEDLNLTLKPEPGILLQVVDEQDRPTAGALAAYVRAGRQMPGPGSGTTISVSDAELFFTQFPLSGQPCDDSPVIAGGGTPLPLEARMPPWRHDGSPATAEDGRLLLSRPCGDIRWIEVSAPNRVKERLEIPVNSNTLKVTLHAGVDVKVVARSGGKPMNRLSLFADPGGKNCGTMTDETGTAYFRGVAPGPLTVKGGMQLCMSEVPDPAGGVVREFTPKGGLDLSLRLSRTPEVAPGAPSELIIDLPLLEETSFKVLFKSEGNFSAVKLWQLGYAVPLNAEGDRLEGNSANSSAAFTIKAPKQGRMLVSVCGVASREEIWHGRLLCELDKIQGDVLEIPVRRGTATLTGQVPPVHVGKPGMINAVEKSAQNFLGPRDTPSRSGLLGAASGMAAPLEKDGRFRMPSLPPGQYDLYLTIFGPPPAEKTGAIEVAVNENPSAPETLLGSVAVPDTGEVHFTPHQEPVK